METNSVWTTARGLFRLDRDLDREGMIASITASVEFQGPNVWSLVLAIFVASIGLNLNSPAIIIGAMLISPLMGPITGAGMALGVYDVRLLRRALGNLALMTAISLIVSTLYFWLSPLKESTTELLNRTAPTFYDVLIALFGGAALMVGLSQKTKSSNLLAGVAIATALMPPLCTAGFGLASQNWGVFTGAIYLYLINSVFIGLATYLFSKALSLRSALGEAADPGRLRKRHLALTVVAMLVFVAPSIYLAYDVVQTSAWRQRLDQFIQANLVFNDAQVVSTKVTGVGSSKTLEIALVGQPLSADLKDHLERQLVGARLDGLKLKFVEPTSASASGAPVTASPASAAAPVSVATRAPIDLAEVTRELEVVFPSLAGVAWGDLQSQSSDQAKSVREQVLFARWRTESAAEQERLTAFLHLRLADVAFRVVHETLPPPAPSR